MRELKFRVWDGYEMLSLSMAHTIGLICIQHDDKDSKWSNLLDSNYEHIKIMQFTGVTDKNGAEIYEGDIVSVKDLKRVGAYTTEVIYSGQGFKLKKNKTRILDYRELFLSTVIGNIYQNPELLEKVR